MLYVLVDPKQFRQDAAAFQSTGGLPDRDVTVILGAEAIPPVASPGPQHGKWHGAKPVSVFFFKLDANHHASFDLGWASSKD